MGRLKDLRAYVNAELNKMENEDKRTGAIVHLYGVSLAATMIAKKRGLDWEIASMAAMLHDLHAYKSGSYDDHAHKGADLAREILGELNLTNEEETKTICSAIYHHDDKLVTDGPMDEVLKDADVIHHCMNDLCRCTDIYCRERRERWYRKDSRIIFSMTVTICLKHMKWQIRNARS